MSHTKAKLIIFDLGRVLIDFDFNAVVRTLHQHSALNERQIISFFEKTPLWDRFERGHVEPDDFFEQLKKELKLTGLDYERFGLLWNNIFTEKHDTVALLRRFRARYRLAMLSNVNILHWKFVAGRHSFMKWFDHLIASYAVGYRKPDPEIFRLVLHEAGLLPSEAVFIDDIETHILAAKTVGIRAYRFVNAVQLASDLVDLL